MVRIISALILAVTAAVATAEEPLKLVDNPPDRYVVAKGDTLWDISGRFLKEPWRWPEVWRMNKDQIKNPHLIYPGDVVYLDESDGKPRLRLGKPVGTGLSVGSTEHVKPKVYSTAVAQVIPSIPPDAIEPYISQPLIIQPGEQDSAPVILTSQEDRIMVGTGDTFYVAGIPDASVEKWHIYRPGKMLKDPDTGKVIAQEAFFLGNARLVKPGEPASLRVTLAKEEIKRGDRLLPAPQPEILTYAPHRPDDTVSARVISIYSGLNEAGENSVVALNRGKNDGLEIGHVLALFRKRVAVNVDDDGRRHETVVPDERYGLAFVFRVFDNIAYALTVQSSKSVIVGDVVRNP